MTKAECFSKGCPFIIKKRDKIATQTYYICGKCGKIIRAVKICPNQN